MPPSVKAAIQVGCATQKRGFGKLVVWTVFPSVLSAMGKGPEGRKSLAQGASPGSRRPSGSREPQRGDRIRFRRGSSPCFCRPFRGLTGAGAWVPRACALG
jgi:hypothetical protein